MDALSFWPRSFNQWAPPSYAARAVPQLCDRLRVLVAEGYDVHLLGHSQGSVVALAILAPGAGRATDLTFMTFGSPLDVLYARFFPAYFDRAEYMAIRSTLSTRAGAPGWRNFFRETGYIGREVFKVDEPPPCDPNDVQVPIGSSEVKRHSDYLTEPLLKEWIRCVEAGTGRCGDG